MSDQNSGGGPVPLPQPARVDNWLVERYELREKLIALLDEASPEVGATAAEVRRLRKKARQCGRNVIRALMDIYLTETGRRSETAFLVLSDYPEQQLQPVLAQALADPALSRDSKLKLVALSAFESERDFSTHEACESIGVQPGELVEAFTGAVADMLEPEEIGLMWLQDFWNLSKDEKLALLSFFIDQANAQFFPALELEAHSAHVEVRRAVARGLRRFEFSEAVDLAQRLLEDRNPTVRYDAHNSWLALQAKGQLPLQAPPCTFETCYCMATPEHGIASILYASRDRRNRIKFCSMMIDAWNRGFSDIWGNVGLVSSKFDDIIRDFIHEASGFGISGDETFQEIPRDYALYLIDEARKLARERRSKLPIEYYVWERLFRHESFSFDPASSLMKFGLNCSVCSQAIMANRRRTNLLVHGTISLCRRCLSAVRSCAACRRSYRLADVHDWSLDRVISRSVCEACSASDRQPMIHDIR